MKYPLLLVLLFIALSCAKQTQPTGGPKDEQPPVLIDSNPKMGSVSFKDSKIELSFSEAVIVDKPKEQILISPSVKGFETTYRKNKVFLTFSDPLADSTTYNLNFRESIKDITEKNPTQNLTLAFSTGAYLDSLSVSGNTFDLLTSKEINDVTVAVAFATDTFNIFKHKAQFFTKASKEGFYNIENLKPAKYFIYAFQDKNKNLLVDSKNEKYGFIGQSINLKEDSTHLMIPIIALDSRPIKLVSAKPLQNYFILKTNKGIKTYEVTFVRGGEEVFSRGSDEASIKIFNTDTDSDSTLTRIILSDSLSNTIDTTLYIKFNPIKEKTTLDKFTIKTNQAKVLEKTGEMTTSISFSKPIKRILMDSIYFQLDSANSLTLNESNVKLDSQTLQLHITINLPKQKESNDPKKEADPSKRKIISINELRLGKGALLSIDNDSSVYTIIRPTYYKEEDLAITLVDVKTTSRHYFIELLNQQNQIIAKSINNPKPTFKDIVPSEYLLRLIIDENNNGVWDPGNYFTNREPEKIFYYYDDKNNQKFTLKANWEYGPLLITSEYSVDKKRNESNKKVKK